MNESLEEYLASRNTIVENSENWFSSIYSQIKDLKVCSVVLLQRKYRLNFKQAKLVFDKWDSNK